MPNSLSPLPTDAASNEIEVKAVGRLPMRNRIQKKIDAIGASVPTRTKVPARSVTPLY